MVIADLAGISFAIALGTVIGKISLFQLTFMATIEVIVQAINHHIGSYYLNVNLTLSLYITETIYHFKDFKSSLNLFSQINLTQFYFKAYDTGESIFGHVFGAYFGLSFAKLLTPRGISPKDIENESSSYQSDIFSMIGTLILWVYWVSFHFTIPHKINLFL